MYISHEQEAVRAREDAAAGHWGGKEKLQFKKEEKKYHGTSHHRA